MVRLLGKQLREGNVVRFDMRVIISGVHATAVENYPNVTAGVAAGLAAAACKIAAHTGEHVEIRLVPIND